MTLLTCFDSLPCPNCFNFYAHLDEIVIAVDGACRSNGRKDTTPRSSYGVFVGDGTPYNRSGKLRDVQTNQVAELEAGLRGLWVARQIADETFDGTLRTVVTKADSEYLVKGMTDWVFKWHANGWKNSKGQNVVNRARFRELMDAVVELENEGVEVLFWHVRRAFNSKADWLANLALDS